MGEGKSLKTLYLSINAEEGWEDVPELLGAEGRVGLQQHQPLAPRVARVLVDVKLKINNNR